MGQGKRTIDVVLFSSLGGTSVTSVSVKSLNKLSTFRFGMSTKHNVTQLPQWHCIPLTVGFSIISKESICVLLVYFYISRGKSGDQFAF